MSLKDTRYFIWTGLSQEQRKYTRECPYSKKRLDHTERSENLPQRDIYRRDQEEKLSFQDEYCRSNSRTRNMKVSRKTNPDHVREKNERLEKRTQQSRIRILEIQRNIEKN